MKIPRLARLKEPGRAVRDFWRKRLPAPQERLYDSLIRDLELSFSMLSVALSEALTLLQSGRLDGARCAAQVSSDLLLRFCAATQAALEAMEQQGKHLSLLPEVTPLNPEFFSGETGRRVAEWDTLLQTVLFSSRSRFFHKLHAIDEAMDGLQARFVEAAEEISEGSSIHPAEHWQELTTSLGDLEICLRETIVVLKSFLHGLAPEQVESFERRLQALPATPQPARHRSRVPVRRSST